MLRQLLKDFSVHALRDKVMPSLSASSAIVFVHALCGASIMTHYPDGQITLLTPFHNLVLL